MARARGDHPRGAKCPVGLDRQRLGEGAEVSLPELGQDAGTQASRSRAQLAWLDRQGAWRALEQVGRGHQRIVDVALDGYRRVRPREIEHGSVFVIVGVR